MHELVLLTSLKLLPTIANVGFGRVGVLNVHSIEHGWSPALMRWYFLLPIKVGFI